MGSAAGRVLDWESALARLARQIPLPSCRRHASGMMTGRVRGGVTTPSALLPPPPPPPRKGEGSLRAPYGSEFFSSTCAQMWSDAAAGSRPPGRLRLATQSAVGGMHAARQQARTSQDAVRRGGHAARAPGRGRQGDRSRPLRRRCVGSRHADGCNPAQPACARAHPFDRRLPGSRARRRQGGRHQRRPPRLDRRRCGSAGGACQRHGAR